MNQNRATNWSTTNSSVTTIGRTNGSAYQMVWGAGGAVVWRILPTTTARIPIQKTQVIARQRRNRDKSEIRRWVTRSKPPKTVSVQKWWYPAECSLMRKWTCLRTSRPSRTNTHQPVRTSIRTASENPTSGSLAMTDHTRRNQISPSRSRNLIRSHTDSGLRVSRSSSLVRPLGGGGGGGGGT